MDLSLNQAQEMLKATAQDFIQREYPKEKLLELEKTDTGCTPNYGNGLQPWAGWDAHPH